MAKLSKMETDLLAYLKEQEFEFILGFLREGVEALDDTALRQLRALWTGYCIHNSVDVDTDEYDEKRRQIVEAVWELDGCPWNKTNDALQLEKLLDEFEMFMCEDLV